jgi:ribosomal protein S21
MKIQKQIRETSQSLVYRFTKAVQRSGILLEARKRRFAPKPKSKNMEKRGTLIKIEKRKEFEKAKKLGKKI